jgi:hypothetical protein
MSKAKKATATRSAKYGNSTAPWWLVAAKRRSQCEDCNARQPEGTAVAYCHGLRGVLCRECWRRRGIIPQPSRKIQKKRQAPQPRKPVPKGQPRAGDLAKSMRAMKKRNAEKVAPVVQPTGPPGEVLRMYRLVSLHPLKYEETQ